MISGLVQELFQELYQELCQDLFLKSFHQKDINNCCKNCFRNHNLGLIPENISTHSSSIAAVPHFSGKTQQSHAIASYASRTDITRE